MKVTITNKKKVKEVHLNQYKITIQFVIGDADGDESLDLFIPKSEENDLELLRFLKFLDNCEKIDPYSHNGINSYKYVDDYPRYTEGYNSIRFDWFYDPIYDCQAGFDGYEITFFDESGIEYLVDVEKS